jgi:hypothetical protein
MSNLEASANIYLTFQRSQAAHDAAHAAFQGRAANAGAEEAGRHQPEAEYVRGGFSLPSPTEYLKNLGQGLFL